MDGPSREEWESLWNRAKGGFSQSWSLNNARKLSGDKLHFFSLRESGSLSALLVASERAITSPLGKKRILEAHGTPLFTSEAAGRQILAAFKDTSKKYFYGTIAPDVLATQSELFKECGYSKVSNHTILIDLTKSEEELWQSAEKKSIRWGIKTAQKNGLSFVPLTDKKKFDKFYTLYEKTAKDGGFAPESRSFVTSLASTSISQAFVVMDKTKLVAGALVLFDPHTHCATLSLTTASEEGLRLQAMPFLYWNIILHAKENKYTHFDMGGYDPDVGKNEKIAKINAFKERFGGNITEHPVFSTNKTYALLRKAFQKVRLIRHLYKKD